MTMNGRVYDRDQLEEKMSPVGLLLETVQGMEGCCPSNKQESEWTRML